MSTSRRTPKILTWTSVAALLIVLVVKTVFIGRYRIPQNGMYPTLPAGTGLFTYKRAYSNPSQVRRGDIIVFIREEDGERYNYIWRVIGLPGDNIVTAGESLTINGKPVTRERVREEGGVVIFREHAGETVFEVALSQSPEHQPPDVSLKVPPDHFFVMGDNRFDARDSRYFGPVAFSAIVGKKL
jgi:signal peptidase I